MTKQARTQAIAIAQQQEMQRKYQALALLTTGAVLALLFAAVQG